MSRKIYIIRRIAYLFFLLTLSRNGYSELLTYTPKANVLSFKLSLLGFSVFDDPSLPSAEKNLIPYLEIFLNYKRKNLELSAKIEPFENSKRSFSNLLPIFFEIKNLEKSKTGRTIKSLELAHKVFKNHKIGISTPHQIGNIKSPSNVFLGNRFSRTSHFFLSLKGSFRLFKKLEADLHLMDLTKDLNYLNYYGFRLNYPVWTGWHFYSSFGRHRNIKPYLSSSLRNKTYYIDKIEEKVFSTGFFLDGTFPYLYGFFGGIGFQSHHLTTKKLSSQSTQTIEADTVGLLALSDIFTQNCFLLENCETVQKTINLSLSYFILAKYFVSFDYEVADIKTYVNTTSKKNFPKVTPSKKVSSSYGIGLNISKTDVFTVEYKSIEASTEIKRLTFLGDKKSSALILFKWDKYLNKKIL